MALFVAGVYWYQSTSVLCPAPLSYRIGDIDQSFNISYEEARSHISEAEALWEGKVDRELFVYDPSSDFVIDFVFDERQATANSEEALSQTLDEQRAENEKVLETVESLQEDHRELSARYDKKVLKYEEDLEDYNAEVKKYNDRGGAPPGVFDRLESDREYLNQEARELTNTAAELNKLASEINRLGERGNKMVESYNREVNLYNAEYGFSREFTQGDYQGKSIHIYKFSSDNELVTVLAHEFGHALGIDHVEDDTSLMYYLLEETEEEPILSTDDLRAYFAVCGTKESFGQMVRRIIRSFL